MSAAAADHIAAVIARQPDAAISFATGNTPMGAYRALAERVCVGALDMRAVRAFQLDEYLDLESDDWRSLLLWLARSVIQPCHVENVFALPAQAPHLPVACAAFERQIVDEGGIDLQILGLGPNGHLGFNEPGSLFDSRTREVTLAPQSIASNAVYWGGEAHVPRRSLTQGLGTIVEAREIILLVSGAHKAGILARALEGPVSPDVPASLLQRHPALTVYADEAAANALLHPRAFRAFRAC